LIEQTFVAFDIDDEITQMAFDFVCVQEKQSIGSDRGTLPLGEG